MSVIVKVRANSPMNVGPQCATVSASIAPGRPSRSSATVRILIEFRSCGDALVVEMPLRRIRSRAGRRYRSTVAALIAASSWRATSVADALSRSPASSSSGSHTPRITTRYFPHGIAINNHTCSSSNRESSPYARGLTLRLSIWSSGAGSFGPRSIRRALERPIPVASTTRSKIRPRSALEPLQYASRSLFVTWRRAAISILPSMSSKPSPNQGPCAQHV
jgi:hypothetical protein